MAIDFEWNGKRWDATKVRRKLTPYEHRGVAFYDRERMRQPLAPIVHPREFDGYSAPPSWAEIPNSWGAWDTLPAEYFIQSGADGSQPVDALDDPPIAQTPDYTLERCYVETVCLRGEWRRGEWITIRQPTTYRWELTFTDGAIFRFVSRAIAETALSELLKIRKAKHPRVRFGGRAPETVFFTDRRLAKLPADSVPTEPAIEVAGQTAA